MHTILPILGRRGDYVARRGAVWCVVIGGSEVALETTVLTQAMIESALGCRVRVLADAIEVVS